MSARCRARLPVVIVAAVAGAAGPPVVLGAPAPPDLYEVAIQGTYSDVLETIPAARDGIGALHEIVTVRWQARTAGAVPLRRVGRRGAAITARLTGAVGLYRRVRSEIVPGAGLACLRVENGAVDPSRPAPRLSFELAGTLTTAAAARLRASPGSLPVVASASQRCSGTIVPEADRFESVALQPVLLPPASELGRLLHVPASTVRRGKPFEVQRTAAVEEPGAVGSGTTRVRRWSLALYFSPCTTAGC